MGKRYEALIIDDYFASGCEKKGTRPLSSFAASALARARAVYDEAKLEGSIEKDVEAQCVF